MRQQSPFHSQKCTTDYSMTLFQSLATQAGWDPVQGPGSSCTADGSSGQCVLPWAGGAKAVSSVVLVANGVSFAVSILPRMRFTRLCNVSGHDFNIYHHWVSCRLWHLWKMVIVRGYCDMLGSSIREHVLDKFVMSCGRAREINLTVI